MGTFPPPASGGPEILSLDGLLLAPILGDLFVGVPGAPGESPGPEGPPPAGSYLRGRPRDKCRLFMNSASSTIQNDPKSSSYLTKHLCSERLVRIAFCACVNTYIASEITFATQVKITFATRVKIRAAATSRIYVDMGGGLCTDGWCELRE